MKPVRGSASPDFPPLPEYDERNCDDGDGPERAAHGGGGGAVGRVPRSVAGGTVG